MKIHRAWIGIVLWLGGGLLEAKSSQQAPEKMALRLWMSSEAPIITWVAPSDQQALLRSAKLSLDSDQARQGWHFVDYTGECVGYMDAGALTKDLVLLDPTPLYSQPNGRSRVIRLLKPADRFELLEAQGDRWIRVRYQGPLLAYFQASGKQENAPHVMVEAEEGAQSVQPSSVGPSAPMLQSAGSKVKLVSASAPQQPSMRKPSKGASSATRGKSSPQSYEGVLVRSKSRTMYPVTQQARYELRSGTTPGSTVIARVVDTGDGTPAELEAYLGKRVVLEGVLVAQGVSVQAPGPVWLRPQHLKPVEP